MEGGGVNKQRHHRYTPNKSLGISLICFSIEFGKAEQFSSVVFGGKQLHFRLHVMPLNQEGLPNVNLWFYYKDSVFFNPSCSEN